MVVVGGNAVGLEQAQLFARLGTRITVIEARERLAPFDDPALSAAPEQNLAAEGMTIHTGATLTRLDRDGEQVRATATIADASVNWTAEHVLVATGRRPVTAGLDLDTVGVKTGPVGEVIVDKYLRTSNNRIWAAGDVTGGPQFV
ncbi:FAD-dependent oxidoreductase, partial [Cronobacter sakazakii]|uniref:FAD-dependent oxidoreductase n=1 Tax=Cronobacter sakazakii TaxID=28141 RepID=UPI00294B6ACB